MGSSLCHHFLRDSRERKSKGGQNPFGDWSGTTGGGGEPIASFVLTVAVVRNSLISE